MADSQCGLMVKRGFLGPECTDFESPGYPMLVGAACYLKVYRVVHLSLGVWDEVAWALSYWGIHHIFRLLIHVRTGEDR